MSLNNPTIRNHKVYGQEILPGLAYIDLIYQVFRKNNYDYNTLELRNLIIYNPLVAGQDYSIILSIRCSETKEGQWQITVEGQEQHQGNPSLDKKCYATAEMYRGEPVIFEETLDLNLIKQSAKRIVYLDQVYEQCQHRELVHTGFMKAEGKVYDTGAAIIMDISIGQDALPSAAGLMFHPTLIDGSGIGASVLLSPLADEEQQLFLPLFYESFRASALLQKQCVTRIQASSIQQEKELLYLTMQFFNEYGQKVGELKNFASKLVRGAELINPDRKKIIQLEKSVQPVPEYEYDSSLSNSVQQFLIQVIASKLHQPANEINSGIGYYEMGLDSRMLLEVVSVIEAKLSIRLTPILLFEYTTIAELADYLSKTYPERFMKVCATRQLSTFKEEEICVPRRAFSGGEHASVASEREGDIAIIGMAGRYPQASNLQEFWTNLQEGKDCISEIPKSRWDWRRLEGLKSPSGKNMSKWGGFLDNEACFDPQFFRISPREAEMMDPQERLFLETCWEAIEDAGYTPKTLVAPRGPNKRRHVGVFVGVMHKDYALIGAEAISRGQALPVSLSSTSIANRVSYFCCFHGPSIAVDTACSSSLTALHLALESIKRGECEVSLVGGVNLSLHLNKYLTYGMMDMHSSDGYCHSFGKGGDGYVSSEGVGAVLLKPLHKAVQDGDHIYAIIKGSVINHVGTVSGITVPSPVAQADMIVECLEKTGIHPRTISYIETHGTGTSLGDPIEIQGLVKAYCQYTQDLQFCSIGSVKSNIGHAESAAGISGLHKAVLQLYNKRLVPSLHSEELNSYIDFKQSPFYVQHKTEEWKQPVIVENGQQVVYPRRAGLSSFGATGSNAHVILEEYIPEIMKIQTSAKYTQEAGPVIIPLSAMNKERLQAYAQKLLVFLQKGTVDKYLNQRKEERKAGVQEVLKAKICKILADVISVKEDVIEADTEWNEYGVEPVHIVQVRDMIQTELMVPINDLDQKSSIASVAAYIINKYGETLETQNGLTAHSEIGVQEETEELKAIPSNNEKINLLELAYTLQNGREAMEERVAFLVMDISELIEKLEVFREGREDVDNCWQGCTKNGKEIIDLLGSDSLELVHKWVAKGSIQKIAEFWVKGLEIDWNLLYGDIKPQRISLPTYPFARERYWIPEINTQSADVSISSSVVAVIHPLLHQNTSNFSLQRFTATFTGQEFFLIDHVINGQRVLPGVAYLEMARAAVVQAADVLDKGQFEIQFKNIVCTYPISIENHEVQVHIILNPEDNGEIAFKVYSGAIELNGNSVVHCQGKIVLSPVTEDLNLDIESLRIQYNQKTLSSTQCYENFYEVGIDYGTAYQGIEKLYMGSGQVMVKLSLPSSVYTTKDQFVLHPSLMASVLQAAAYVMVDSDESIMSANIAAIKPALPFTIQELRIFSHCTNSMWAVINISDRNNARDQIKKMDVDLCDEKGRICVQIKGLAWGVPETEIQINNILKEVPSKNAIEHTAGTVMLLPVWETVQMEKNSNFPSPTDRILIVGGGQENRILLQQFYTEACVLEVQPKDSIDDIRKKLEVYGVDHIFWVAPYNPLSSLTEESFIEDQEQGVLKVFRMIKALLSLGYSSIELGLTVITIQTQPIYKEDLVNPTHASIHGLIGSLAKEYPNWKIRLIDMEAGCNWPIADIVALPSDRRGHPWVYRNQQWYQQQLIPFQCPPIIHMLYRIGGVYVVIGGAGGIGEDWSEYMIRTYNAQIIWIGRRQKDENIQNKLDRLADMGPVPHYITADATDLVALRQAYEEIKKQYSQIHGVIHSAMVFSGESLANMEEIQFKAGLSAKVEVSVRIEQVFQKEPLDFVMFFSSMISFIKNPKQSHYASGCAFKDAFAYYLRQKWPCAVKVMNWGYWASDKVAAFEDFKQLSQIGLGLIEPKDGMQALELLLNGPVNQVAMMKTTKPLIVEGMKQDELITVYQEKFSSSIQNMQKYIPERDLQDLRMKLEENQQMEEINELQCKLLWCQLRNIGSFSEKKTVIADLKTKIGLCDTYDRWLEESIAVLVRNNYLSYDGVTCFVMDLDSFDIASVWKEWEQKKALWLEKLNLKAWVVLTETMLRALPEILTGKVLATNIMFPDSSMKLVEGIYKNNIVADYFNDVLANIVVAYIQERLEQDVSAQIRIIEIGAGTGGTSTMVFKKLMPYQDNIYEYCYTDVSKVFLMYAEKEYGPENPYLTYRIFNAEEPVVGQGIDVGGYDIIIVANVLHATKNIKHSIRNIKSVLQRNGLILLNEISRNSLFTHLSFGLLDGWWLYEDTSLRIPGCPGLYPETWKEVLEGEGFRSASFPAQEAHDLGQQIIVAESDGIVRQKQQLKPNVVLSEKKNEMKVMKEQTSKKEPSVAQTEGIVEDVLRERTMDYFKKLVGETLKIPSHKVDSSMELGKYGLDSLLIIHLTNALHEVFDDVSSTLFFEYHTIDALVEYFIQNRRNSLIEILGLKGTVQ